MDIYIDLLYTISIIYSTLILVKSLLDPVFPIYFSYIDIQTNIYKNIKTHMHTHTYTHIKKYIYLYIYVCKHIHRYIYI